jgi:hypothetical protein
MGGGEMAVRNFTGLSGPSKEDPAEAIAEIVEYTLGELRHAREVTPDELARGATPSPMSRIDHGGEMELSTLRGYVEALGERLEVTAVFDDDRFPITAGLDG